MRMPKVRISQTKRVPSERVPHHVRVLGEALLACRSLTSKNILRAKEKQRTQADAVERLYASHLE